MAFLTRAGALAAAPGIILAAVLSLPALPLGYFWDDYVFLTRAQSSPIHALASESGVFLRPIPRVLYFWPLASLGTAGAPIAHGVNLLLLVISVALLVSIVRELAGSKAGAIAGIAFASLAPVPSLVAWASASQDLLAILFVLMAFRFRHSGRMAAAGIAFSAGLLSKETTAVLAPALIFWDWMVGIEPARTRTAAITMGTILIAWLVVHPGIRSLTASGFAVMPHHYVGFANLALAEFHAQRYMLALFNIPRSVTGPWDSRWLALGTIAVAVAAIGVWLAAVRDREPSARRFPIYRAFLLAFLISAPTLALPALVIQTWAGYFVCLPGIGSALLLGVLLSRISTPIGVCAVALFVALGLSIRGSRASGGDAFTERAFTEASRAAQHVEEAFRTLHPTFPRGSQLLVSVASSGRLGIDGAIHDGQALRIWYRDPTLRILRPERRQALPGEEFLFRITGERDVVEIDPDRESFNSSGGRTNPEEMRAILRTYARGLGASGDTARAIRILQRMAAEDEEPLKSYDLRLAAMTLLGAHDSAGAVHLLSKAQPISREFALYGMAKVLAEPTGNADVDSSAFLAFGISPSDMDALRHFMNMFYASEFVPQAVDFARRIQSFAPGDSASEEVLARLRADRAGSR